MSAAVMAARRRHLRYLELMVTLENPTRPAQLYWRLGFRPVRGVAWRRLPSLGTEGQAASARLQLLRAHDRRGQEIRARPKLCTELDALSESKLPTKE
jgi:hypothetical protein